MDHAWEQYGTALLRAMRGECPKCGRKTLEPSGCCPVAKVGHAGRGAVEFDKAYPPSSPISRRAELRMLADAEGGAK